MKWVVFTDLDGTLLDPDTYSYEKAVPAIERLKEMEIPIVFCSAKTRAEQEVYRRELVLYHPFIVENGGAIFIPVDYFPFAFDYHKVVDKLLVIELATPLEKTKAILNRVKKENGFSFQGFADMTAVEIAKAIGLNVELARLAKEREYSETIKFDDRGRETDKALEKIKEAGLDWYFGAQFYHVYHVMQGGDKGRAVAILIDLYHRMWSQIRTIGIGDSLNDLPMLALMDVPILVQKKDHSWENVSLPGLRKIEGIGPQGWNSAIAEVIEAEIASTLRPKLK